MSSKLPHEVYGEEADFVHLAFKTMTARRMVRWLDDLADVYEIGGSDKSSEDVRVVARRIRSVTRETKGWPEPTQCHIDDCENVASRELYFSETDDWRPYCPDCEPGLGHDEERPLEPADGGMM